MLLKFIGQIKAYFKLIQQKKKKKLKYKKFEIIRHCMRIYSTCDYVTIKKSIFSSMKITYFSFMIVIFMYFIYFT